MAGGAFCRAGRQPQEASQKDPGGRCLWKFLGKDPMVCGVAWGRGVPSDGDWKRLRLDWVL